MRSMWPIGERHWHRRKKVVGQRVGDWQNAFPQHRVAHHKGHHIHCGGNDDGHSLLIIFIFIQFIFPIVFFQSTFHSIHFTHFLKQLVGQRVGRICRWPAQLFDPFGLFGNQNQNDHLVKLLHKKFTTTKKEGTADTEDHLG